MASPERVRVERVDLYSGQVILSCGGCGATVTSMVETGSAVVDKGSAAGWRWADLHWWCPGCAGRSLPTAAVAHETGGDDAGA